MIFKRTLLGIRLAFQSLKFFRVYYRLLIFPLTSRCVYLLVTAGIAFTLWYLNHLQIDTEHLSWSALIKLYSAVAIVLFASNCLGAFCAAAFAVTIAEYHAGLKPTVFQGIRAAKTRWKTLLSWSLFRVTFGPLMIFFGNFLREYSSINKLVNGLSWINACYFVEPTIMFHPGHVLQALQESSRMMLEHAGRRPRINFIFAWPLVFLRIAAIIPLGIAINHHNLRLATAISVITAVLLTVISIINVTVNQAVHSALFQFIKTKHAPAGFEKKDLEHAITRR